MFNFSVEKSEDFLKEVVGRLGYNRVRRILEGDAARWFVASCRKFVNKNPEIESDIMDEVGNSDGIDVANTIYMKNFKFLNKFLEDRYQTLDVLDDNDFFRVIVESVRHRPELHLYSFEEIISDLVDFYETELYFS